MKLFAAFAVVVLIAWTILMFGSNMSPMDYWLPVTMLIWLWIAIAVIRWIASKARGGRRSKQVSAN